MGFKINAPADQSRVTASKGIHVAVVKKVEHKESGNNNPMLVFRYESQSPGEEGRTIFDNVVMTPAAAWRYTKVFLAFGLKPNARGDFNGLTEKSFEGKKVRLVIEHEDYQGETKARVREVLPLGEGKSALAATAASDDEGDEPMQAANLDEGSAVADIKDNPEDDLPF